MKLVATFTKGYGKFKRSMKLYFNNRDEYDTKRNELINNGWHLTSYTQVEA